MVAIFDLIERVVDCDSTILINGETDRQGLVARAIH
jgi:transcriptional regulator with GAF, ATPase, and Fis domain